jgi:hypothetical protein
VFADNNFIIISLFSILNEPFLIVIRVCVHNRILAWKNDLGGCFGIVNTEIHEA